MELDEVMDLLRARGKPATADVYRRQGVVGETYGVSAGDLGAVVKLLKVDHALAIKLWDTEIHDARVLATKLVDPARLKHADIERWLEGQSNSVIVEAVAGVAARMTDARTLGLAWIAKDDEWHSSAGWAVIAQLAMAGKLEATDATPLVARIRKEIHGARNRTRYSMNGALIAIGSAMPALRTEALDAARAIGKVTVDHGETGYMTPDAAEYITKTVQRAAEVAARGPGSPMPRRVGRPLGRAVRPMSQPTRPATVAAAAEADDEEPAGDGEGFDDGGHDRVPSVPKAAAATKTKPAAKAAPAAAAAKPAAKPAAKAAPAAKAKPPAAAKPEPKSKPASRR